MMEFVILTGLSGAGKGRVKSIMADLGYYCVDNMPGELIDLMVELAHLRPERFNRVVLVVDVRLGGSFEPLFEAMAHMKMLNFAVRVLYLDARNEYIVRRYKETRRRHPLDDAYPALEDAIEAERLLLEPLRARADMVMDTTDLSENRLKEQLTPVFGIEGAGPELVTELRTFGFKRGLPLEADLVFDVRFLPNPYYVPELRPLTGLDAPVSEFVMGFQAGRRFLHMLCELMGFLIPQYQAEGRQKLVVAIGCTGGRHRSVAIAEQLRLFLSKEGGTVKILHRDMDKT